MVSLPSCLVDNSLLSGAGMYRAAQTLLQGRENTTFAVPHRLPRNCIAFGNLLAELSTHAEEGFGISLLC